MEIALKDIAELLKSRRDTSKRTVLFLGARAGGLYGNSTLYNKIEKFSVTSFDNLDDIEKFAKCYDELQNNQRFNESNIYDILSDALKNEPGLIYRQEDDCLMELVKEEFFDAIISTNFDVLLEETFIHEGMKDPYDYHIYMHSREFHKPDNKFVHNETKCSIVKVFGDIRSRDFWTVGSEFDLDDDKNFKQFLESTLAKDILMVGFDPKWDGPIRRAFPTRGGEFWYVNEKKPEEDSLVYESLRNRSGKSLHGWQGSYNKFMKDLHSHILNRRPLSYGSMHKVFTHLQQIDRGITGLQNEMTILRTDVEKLLAFKEQSVQPNQQQGDF